MYTVQLEIKQYHTGTDTWKTAQYLNKTYFEN